MAVFLPESLAEAFEMLAGAPGAQLLAGGTDFMVEVNAGRRRPTEVLCLGRVPEVAGWRLEGEDVVLGSGLTYTEMMGPELSRLVPGLALAARTVGSPQIRNAGTLGGNLATASPAGDALPVLAALGARIVVGSSPAVTRTLALGELIVGPKRTVLLPDEVILEVRVRSQLGSQEFLKVGTRNAMVISVASVAVVADWVGRRVRVALGSVGPTVIEATEADEFAASVVDWDDRRLAHGAGDLAGFVARVRAAANPIDDHRSTAEYRRHAVGICAERALRRLLGHDGRELQWAS